MSKLDEIAKNIDHNRRNPSKRDLTEFVKESLEQIGQINNAYQKYFSGTETEPAILEDIESKLETAVTALANLYPAGVADTAVVDQLREKVAAIEAYHKELLEDDGIKADITDSQQKINDFYNQIFSNETVDGIKKQVVDFYTTVTKEGGIESETNRIYDEITSKHKELFLPGKGKTTSKIKELENNIVKAEKHQKNFEETVNPAVASKLKELDDITIDIATKQNELGALLSDATAKTLADGYSESKHEYSSRKARECSGKWYSVVSTFTYNNIGRHGSSILNYILFIAPLAGVSLIFASPQVTQIIMHNLSSNSINTSNLEVLYAKSIISLPLLWIAWFGQRNISHRKRLFEEYNHKLRVVQMYILFNEGSKTYKLAADNVKRLESVLIEAIGNNPAEHLGRGETYLDQVRNAISKKKDSNK